MKYRKLSVRWTGQPDSLYRILMIPEDLSLMAAGCVILTAFHVKDPAAFAFCCDGYTTEFRPDMTDDMADTGETFADLPDEFLFRIGSVFPWEFRCRKTGRPTARSTGDYVIDGAGSGIVEDGPERLTKWLNNKEFREDFEDLDIPKENLYISNMNDQTLSWYDPVFLWASFLEKLDDADEESGGKRKIRSLKKAWKEFYTVCMDLKEAGRLPATLRELAEETCDMGDDGEDFYNDVIGIVDDLFVESADSDVVLLCRQMQELFPLDSEAGGDLVICKASSLNRLGQHDEALKCADDALHNDPEDPVFQAIAIDTLLEAGKLDEAAEYADRYRLPLEECDTSNIALFMSLQKYEELRGNIKEAERIREKVDEVRVELEDDYFQDAEDEMMDLFGDLSEEDDLEPGQILMKIIDRYDQKNSDTLWALVLSSLVYMKDHGIPVIPAIAESVEDDAYIMMDFTDQNGGRIRRIYSCEEAALRDGYVPLKKYTLPEIMDDMNVYDYAGVTIDPIAGRPRFVLTAEGFLEIMELSSSPDDSGLLS